MKKAFAFLASAGLLSGLLLITGCGEESSVQHQETIKTPGGETQITEEKTIERSGDHADGAVPAETPAVTPETPPGETPNP